MSRSVGDVLAKRAGVVAEPEVTQFVLDPETAKHIVPRYVVLASDGVWDVMSNE
jgi:serine/threonine protein phosphatase PrpC